MPRTITARITSDHMQRIAGSSKRPVLAIYELIANSLDADADTIHIKTVKSPMGGLQKIIVEDDGYGIDYDQVETFFGDLGNSWKKGKLSKKKKRHMQGKIGEGRYRVFAIASYAKWATVYSGLKFELTCDNFDKNTGIFVLTDPEKTKHKNGTTVDVQIFKDSYEFLLDTDYLIQKIAARFKLYLSAYKDINIFVNKKLVDVKSIIADTINLSPFKYRDYPEEINIEIVRWLKDTKPSIEVFNNDNQFIDREKKVNTLANSLINSTVYVRSDVFNQISHMSVIKDSPEYDEIIELVFKKIKDHFKEQRRAEKEKTIKEWKKAKIYPYKPVDDISEVEQAERNLFDILALYVFEKGGLLNSEKKQKKLSLALLKEIISKNPGSFGHILSDVFRLPKQDKDIFNSLLQEYRLANIIAATNKANSRLKIAMAIEDKIYNKKTNKILKEVPHLQNFFYDNLWLFKEGFDTASRELELTEIMKREFPELKGKIEPVNRPGNKKKGFVDFMLICSKNGTNDGEKTNIIIELKRPSIKLSNKEAEQVRSYARGISSHPRFKNTNAKWYFYLIGAHIHQDFEDSIKQKDKPYGLFQDPASGDYEIWILPWSSVLNEAKAKLRFYKENIGQDITLQSALKHIEEAYDYLP
ncbi:MAG: ATP-binding protein [Pseudodesulfovibrio sp.]|uniref:ATP-binding protein n=1 Tax=Pseudodesulfovibrio sp. TaxID=2035812 RepID=UPI003D118016